MPTKTKPAAVRTHLYQKGVVVNTTQTDTTSVQTGTANPNWRLRIANGEDVTSNYASTRYIVEKLHGGSAGYTQILNSTGAPGPSEQVWGIPDLVNGPAYSAPISQWEVTSVDNQALKSIYNKIRSEQERLNGLVLLGELRESLSLLRNPFKGLRTAVTNHLSAIKKKRETIGHSVTKRKSDSVDSLYLRRRKELVKETAGLQLELNFGVLPLISDIQSASQAVYDTLTRPSSRTRVRSYYQARSVDPYRVPGIQRTTLYADSYIVVDRTEIRTSTYGVQYIVGIRSDLSGPLTNAEYLRRVSGATLQNFVPTLYELCPWSFLIDYFSNLGDCIEAACASQASLTYKVKTVRDVTDTVRGVNVNWAESKKNAAARGYQLFGTSQAGGDSGFLSHMHITRSTIARTRLSSLPMPTLQLDLPGRATQYGNMVALLVGARVNQWKF